MSGRKISPQPFHQQSLQSIDISAVNMPTGAKCQRCGSQTHQRKDSVVQRCDLQDLWQTRTLAEGNTQTPRNGSPKGIGQGYWQSFRQRKNEHLKHVSAVERKDTRKQNANSRLQHSQSVERLVTRERCVETRTHTRLRRMQMNQVQKSLSKHFAAWLFKTLSRMLIMITLRFTKEVQSIEADQKFRLFADRELTDQ